MEDIEAKKRRATLEKERMQERNLERVKQVTEIEHKRKSERSKLKQADKKEAVGAVLSLSPLTRNRPSPLLLLGVHGNHVSRRSCRI